MSSRSGVDRPTGFALGVLALTLAGAGCEMAEPREREVVTQIAALEPSPAPAGTPPAAAGAMSPVATSPIAPSTEPEPSDRAHSACPDVERQARELGAVLPRQLDADTRATGVTAQGCDLTLEYQLVTLTANEVAESGLRAMRSRVMDQLCSDTGALGVMQRGGRFTNVYYDRVHAPIGVFTVAADDCGI
jgi:hypothetical protein